MPRRDPHTLTPIRNMTDHDDSAPVSADHVDLPSDTMPAITTQHVYSRLPKLTLPTFNGNPLQWQTFWDSFTAAVDSNPTLSQVQKLNYRRAQLQGDACSPCHQWTHPN